MNASIYKIIGINCRYSHSCLALFYVRNQLELYVPDCQAEIIECTINDSYYDTLLRISQAPADGLFFSAYIWNSVFIERLIRDLSQILPETPLVLGGPQAPYLTNLPDQCTVVEGEIESVDSSFYADLKQGQLLSVYKGRGGALFHSPYRDDDFGNHLKNKHIYYESSRGCPFFCSYCLSSVKRGVFHKNIKEVKEELCRILKWRPKLIKFVDRTFNDNPERALQIWQFLAEYAGDTKFHFEIAPDRFTEKMFRFLETVAGDLFQFEIGIQSTHPQTLEAVNRQMDISAAAENVERLISFDTIHVHADLILGLPYENSDSFQASFNTVFYMRPHYIQMGLLKVLPGTEIRRKAEEYGLLFCEQPTYSVLKNNWLDHQSLARLHDFGECVESFYNNRYFRSIWSYIFDKNEDPFAFFFRLLQICREYNFFQYSPTQKLLNSMLVELVKSRSDKKLLSELLRFDWLRCGHRFLPDSLEQESLSNIRITLSKKLPQSMEGVYSYKNRNDFLKSSIFLKMSNAALEVVGLQGDQDNGYVCFLPEQTTGVYKHSRVIFITV